MTAPSAAQVRMMRRKAERVADELAEVADAFPGAFDGDAIGQLRHVLAGIAEGDFYPAGLPDEDGRQWVGK